MSGSDTMPALFIGHGTPMNALESNAYTDAWSEVTSLFPREPAAYLVVSAHWYLHQSALTAMAAPRTIHDFYGFPKALFDVEYRAPGDPALARRVAEMLAPLPVALDTEQWGLDHGAWSVLARIAPDASTPVVQLSIDGTQGIDFHMALGERLATLLDEGVCILCSGNVVHNLSLCDVHDPNSVFSWALEFDEVVHGIMTNDPHALPSVMHHEAYARAVPTPEHFLPLAYLAGVSIARGETVHSFVRGATFGALTMTSYATVPAR